MNEHLRTDEDEQHADTHLQIAELIGHGSQQEEQRTQAQYRKNIGEEHHVWIERDGEYRRDAVERKDDVAKLDEYHREHQWTEMEMLVQKSHHRMTHGIDLLLLVTVEEHLGTAVQQERTEYQENPLKATDKSRTSKDKDEAQDDGSQDTPVERMLVFLLVDAKRGEYHHHHEEVIHGQGLFYQVT